MLQVSNLQVRLSEHCVSICHTNRVWKQGIMGDFSWVSHVIVLDLIQVHTLGEFVSFAEGYYGNFMLTCQVRDH